MDNLINFGKLLKDKRNEKGLTQDELAGNFYCTRQYISKIENSEQYCYGPLAVKIYSYFGIGFDIVKKKENNMTDFGKLEGVKTPDEYEKFVSEFTDYYKKNYPEYSYVVLRIINNLIYSSVGYAIYKGWYNNVEYRGMEMYDIASELLGGYDRKEKLSALENDFNGINLRYASDIDYDFYILGMDLFEDFEGNNSERRYIGATAMEYWNKLEKILIKGGNSYREMVDNTLITELKMAINDLIDLYDSLAG